MTPFPPRAPASVPPCPGSSTTTFSVRLGVAGAAGCFGVSCAGGCGGGAGACAFGGAGDGVGAGSCAWPVQAGAANIIAPAISRRIAEKKILRTWMRIPETGKTVWLARSSWALCSLAEAEGDTGSHTLLRLPERCRQASVGDHGVPCDVRSGIRTQPYSHFGRFLRTAYSPQRNHRRVFFLYLLDLCRISMRGAFNTPLQHGSLKSACNQCIDSDSLSRVFLGC